MSLKVVMFSSNVLTGEFVLRSHRASPFTKPFFASGGYHVVKNVHWIVLKMLFVITIWVLCKKGGPLNQNQKIEGGYLKSMGAIE